MQKPSWMELVKDTVMVLAMILLLALLTKPAHGQDLKRTAIAKWPNGDSVMITKRPCSLKSEWFKDWFAAEMYFQHKAYAACWRLLPGRTGGMIVAIFDSDGEITTLPMHIFKALPSS